MAKKTTPKKTKTEKASLKTAPKKTTKSVLPTAKLRMWNLRFAALLVLQAAAIVLLGRDVSAPVTGQYLTVDTLATEVNGRQTLATASRHLFDLPMVWVVAAFLLLLAAVYVAAATFYRKRYEAGLERSVSETRWLGLGLSGAALLVAISLLSGITQASSLLMVAVFTLVGCALALATEVVARDNPKRRLVHLLCGVAAVSVIVPWVVLKLGVLGALLNDGTVPTYLYGIYASTVLFFVAGMLATHFRVYRKGRWADGYYAEGAFMALGFVAVSVVAWQIFAGALAS